MRIFVYKLLVFLLAIFFLYHLTIGYSIYKFQNKFYSSLDKETAVKFKNKIRDEITSSLQKDRILKKEDALLLNRLFKKLSIEIKNAEK